MHQDHEVDGAYTAMLDDAVTRACVLAGDQLTRLAEVLEGLQLDPERMRANLGLTGGLIVSEAVMLALGRVIGRQEAHRVVAQAARRAAAGEATFAELLNADARVAACLDATDLAALLDPTRHLGLSAEIALAAARRARAAIVAHRSPRPSADKRPPQPLLPPDDAPTAPADVGSSG
jgi:adenylosuccinate lyase